MAKKTKQSQFPAFSIQKQGSPEKQSQFLSRQSQCEDGYKTNPNRNATTVKNKTNPKLTNGKSSIALCEGGQSQS
jgi:hypothetical protein